ncbi:Oligopeptide-binding protein AppA precursor [Paraliobacillus sp. PM-2]|uniref:ABC transporter substrate-binding protein n=1 Tax=Paraliobacillus sp. PM-2 TaxID=1462524 RepID=UPI00061CD890|nr:ABC transporter substrate-binding protein [Paraliobacillus sp. PM-2]CQR46817.1 Oligopeptide-binding protein AppA precursor [Paraliobacillus sp. PM-2]
MKKISQFLFFAILICLILTACGTEEMSTSKDETSNTNAESSAEVDNNDEVIRIAMKSEIDSLDPYQASATDTEIMMDNVFDGLFDIDKNGELVPNLATDYKISDDNLTYTFTLVENATFHNGDSVTAEDVVYSYSKLAGLETGKPMSDKWSVVEDVKSTGKYKVEVKLKNIDSGFLARTTNAILPSGYENQATQPIGAGPFKFVEHKVAQELVLERNKDYYMQDKIPEVSKVHFVIMSDTQTAILAMQSGEIDIIPGINAQSLMQLQDSVTTISGPQNMPVIFGLNHKAKPLSDINVRKAINMAIDKNQIINTVMQGNATKIDSNFSPAMAFYYEDGVEGYYDFDVKAAKELLETAGYPDGFNLSMTVPSHATMYTDTAQIIAEQLSQIGIKVDIEPVEWSTWLERVYTKFDYESTIIGLTGKIDPYDVLIRFENGYSRNFINYNNPEYDAAIENAIQETEDNKRAAYYKEAQMILTEDAASVFIMDPDTTIAMREGLTGLKLYPIGKLNLEDLTITE